MTLTTRRIAQEMLRLYNGNPTRWTRGLRARDERGAMVAPESPDAVCWCVVGASARVFRQLRVSTFARQEFVRALESLTREPVAEWNDEPSRTFAEVESLLKMV